MKEQLIKFKTAKLTKEKGFDWIVYLWIIIGNLFLFGCIARLLTFNLIKNNWSDVVWFICGLLSMISVKFFYRKTVT